MARWTGSRSRGPALERYRKLRDAWLTARRDLIDRRNRMRELALEADRLNFALNEIDTVDPQPGEDDALVADIVRLSELDTLREAAVTAHAALSGALDDVGPDTAPPTAWGGQGPHWNQRMTRSYGRWPGRSARR